MRTLETEGFVLRRRVLRGQDSAYTLFTADLGKLRVIAKGVKKITSKRAPHLQTGNYVVFLLTHSNEQYYLQDTKLKSGFLSLKDSRLKLEQIYLFLFVLDRLLAENQPEAEIFNLTRSFFVTLGKQQKEESIVYTYLNDLLRILGYLSQPVEKEEVLQVIEKQINEKIPENII